MKSQSHEYNLDGLIGPTHNFSGLSRGNLPSQENTELESNPKIAAFQGLDKMKLLHDLGVNQVIVPPQERPYIKALHDMGYKGSDEAMFVKVVKKDFQLLRDLSSASSMWLANAATMTPSADSENKKVHITIANLLTQKHRSYEPPQSSQMLKMIIPELNSIVYHPFLPDDETLFDEGAANHMRICEDHGKPGIEIFVYGKIFEDDTSPKPKKLPARQSFEASRVIALSHHLPEERIVYAQQNPDAIDQGVFHNDVIATSNENVMLYHEMAFVNTQQVIQEIKDKFERASEKPLQLIEVKEDELSVNESVATYLFNSQIVTLPQGHMAIIAPQQCKSCSAHDVIERILSENNPINELHFVDLGQSMRNGGGPACLRLRSVLTDREAAFVQKRCIFTDEIYARVRSWIDQHYRDQLNIKDLGDPQLFNESRRALDELTRILGLGSIYSFQR